MPKRHHHYPVSERLRSQLSPEDLQQVQALERFAAGELAHVSTNGKFPHWPVERYITVLGFLGLIISIVASVGAWRASVDRDLADLKADVGALSDRINDNRISLSSEIKARFDELGARIKFQVPTTPRQSEPVPTFPREDHFAPGPPE